MCYSGDFINSPEQEEETIEMVKVDRHVPIASEALRGCLDGHVTVVHHERRSKTTPVSRSSGSGE